MRTLFILLLFPSLASAAELSATVDPLVAPLTKDKPKLGLVVGVWVDGKPHTFGYGKVTTPQGEATPTGDTIFEIGSITKAFTSILLAEAVTRKEVALDDSANKHLPSDLAIQMKSDKPITLSHLATHRSGLPVQPPLIGLFARNSANPYADYTHEKLVKLMANLKPTREPEKEYEYSNLGVGLLGHALVTAAKAESFDALVKDRVCRPLKLTSTGEAMTGAMKARFARGHTKKFEPTDPWEFACLEACGGLRSNTNDLLKFAAANLGEPKTSLHGAMTASHERRFPTESDDVHVALCWHLSRRVSGETIIWHNGGTGGYHSFLAFTPSTKRAVVVLCATALDSEVDELGLKVLEAIQPK